MAQICALIALVQPVLHQVSFSNRTLTNTPKHYESHKNMSLGSNGVDRVRSLRKIPMRLNGTNLSLVPMGWIECVLCEQIRCDFMAQTCALIALVQPILHRVSCSNETLTNAPKHYENMSLGSNGVDRERSLPKIPMRVRGTNICINCTSSAYFASSFMQ